MANNELNSVNPVFVNFTVTSEAMNVTFGSAGVQKGEEIIEKLSSKGAKMGYGIGYAGTPQATNISYDGPDVPFSDTLTGIKWGRAVLCKAAKSPSGIALTEQTGGDPAKITGTCFGTTIKDSSIQLNAAIAVAGGAVVDPIKSDATSALVIAIMCNGSIDGQGVYSDSGETVLAISEAIDPTVFNVNEDGLQFQIPDATGGYTFTVRGTLAKAPFVNHVSNYTSMKDKVSSFPTSQAILDAKVNA